jgi:glycosyltransferase involved in cell wall biosynthesis
VLVVGPVPPPTTGRAVVTAAVVEAWRAAGVDVALADVAVRGGQPHKAVRYLAAVGRAARARGGVVVVASDGPWLVADAIVALVARARGRRLAIHHHSWGAVAERSRLMSVLVAAAGRDARHVVLCPAMAAALRSRHRRVDDVVVVSNAGVVARGAAHPPSPGRLVLGMLGNLTAAKGLLRALAVLDDLPDDVGLVLAGPIVGADEEAAVAAVGERVEVLGPVDAAQRAAFLARCDLLLFPSDYRNEAQPMALLEALAAGVPVVAVERGCIAGDLAGLGWTVPDVAGFAALAHRAIAALADPAERARRSALAVARSERLAAEAADQLTALGRWLTDGAERL